MSASLAASAPLVGAVVGTAVPWSHAGGGGTYEAPSCSELCQDRLSEPGSPPPLALSRSCSTPSATSSSCTAENEAESACALGESESPPQAFLPLTAASRAVASRGLTALLQTAAAGLDAGFAPELLAEGLGGSYVLRSEAGVPCAVFKPCDEEAFGPANPKSFSGRALGAPGYGRGVRVGEAALREAAAYLLDHGGKAKVPRTALVTAMHPVALAAFHSAPGAGPCGPKPGSLQAFVRHDSDASECGAGLFPAAAVHAVGALDIRLLNTDRHTGNLLVRESPAGEPAPRFGAAAVELIPIDHGYALPETLEAAYFEWLHWPQAALPFSPAQLADIAALDGAADAALLAAELPQLAPACGRLLQLTTAVLQRGAANGLCLADIGGFLSRPLVGLGEEPSAFETLIAAALHAAAAAACPPPPRAPPAPGRLAAALAGTRLVAAPAASPPAAGWAEEGVLAELSEGDAEGSEEEAAEARLPTRASAAVPVPVPSGGVYRPPRMRVEVPASTPPSDSAEEVSPWSSARPSPSPTTGALPMPSPRRAAGPPPPRLRTALNDALQSRSVCASGGFAGATRPAPRPAPPLPALPPLPPSTGAFATFADVPEPLWPAFFEGAFRPRLEAAVAAARRGGRAAQLVTKHGTRVEAFGTSAPTSGFVVPR